MTENLAPLTYAVRPKVIAKYLGQLMLMLALLKKRSIGQIQQLFYTY